MIELLNFKFLMFNRVMFTQGLTIACTTRSEKMIFEWIFFDRIKDLFAKDRLKIYFAYD